MTVSVRGLSAERTGALVRARVTAVEEDGRVRISRRGERPTLATIAVCGVYAPRVGDTVLIGAGAAGERYVIGVLGALRAVEPAAVRAGGISVDVVGQPGQETVSVRDAAGKLLFEHDAAGGKSVVHVPTGDLELRADQGNIDLVAGLDVRVRADHVVHIGAGQSVQIATPAVEGQQGSSVSVGGKGFAVAAPEIDARANRAEFAIGDARLIARSIATTVETAKHVVGVLETRATRIVESARNVFREATELSQTRAGRMRLVAENTFHLLGKRTFFKAEKDMKLKGEKIYLA